MLRRVGLWAVPRRGLLSAAFGGGEAWKGALARLPPAPSLSEMHSRLEAAPGSLDVEMFAHHAAAAAGATSELADLLHRLRVAAPAPSSLCHATVRAFLAAGAIPQLLDVLDDRLNYGIFLDDLTANLLLDRLVEDGDFASAAKVAGFLTMQENYEGPIAREFALYSAYKFLKDYRVKVEEEVVAPVVPTATTPKSKKKPEEIKIRVRFLRNEFFDDHFDLRGETLIAGKTLVTLSKNNDDPLHLNCLLIGWTFYKKYEKAKDVAEIICNKNVLYEETKDVIQRLAVSAIEESEEKKSLTEIFSLLENITPQKVDVENDINQRIKSAIDKHEGEHNSRHIQILNEWEKERNQKLNTQLEILEENELIERHRARNEALEKINEKIWFFDNEAAVDLKIQHKNKLTPKPDSKNKNKKSIDQNEKYVPPEVFKRRILSRE